MKRRGGMVNLIICGKAHIKLFPLEERMPMYWMIWRADGEMEGGLTFGAHMNGRLLKPYFL